MATVAATDNVSFGDIVRVLRTWRLLAAGIVVVCLGLGAAYASLATKYYRADVTLTVRSPGEEANGGGVLGRLGGLAAGLTGMAPMGGQGVEEIAWLESRQFAERFIRAENLMPEMFPGKWDAGQARWRTDLAPEKVPTIEDAWRYFDDRMRTVQRDRRTGIVTLQVRWKDPAEAARLANLMITKVNDELRQRAIVEADTSIQFLKRELDANNAVTLQQGIYRLIEAQIQRKVVANSRPDYAFSVIDPAAAPDRKRVAFPRWSIVIGISLLAGLILAGVIVFVAEVVTSQRSRRAV